MNINVININEYYVMNMFVILISFFLLKFITLNEKLSACLHECDALI